MTETEGRIYSYSDILEILYKLQKDVQAYRSENVANISGATIEQRLKLRQNIIKTYMQAADIAADELNKTSAAIFAEIMQPLKRQLVEAIVLPTERETIAISNNLLSLFDKEKVREFQRITGELIQLDEPEKDCKTDKKKVPTRKTELKEKEDTLFFRLKKELIAAIEAKPNDKLSAAEKKKYIQMVEKAMEMNVTQVYGQINVTIDETKIPVVLYIKYRDKNGNIYSSHISGASRYGFLDGKKDIPRLSRINSKKGTVLKSSLVKQKEEADKRKEKRTNDEEKAKQQVLAKLQEKRAELLREQDNAFKALIASIDAQELFAILTKDRKRSAELLNLLRPNDKNNGL